MKRLMRTLIFSGLTICVALTLPGCALFKPVETKQVSPEPIGNYVVLVYELPFVYKKDEPQQEAFLSVIREVIAPADWKKGPDNMRAIANMLVVSTTAENHMRLERFFDSIPDIPAQHSDAWVEPSEKADNPE